MTDLVSTLRPLARDFLDAVAPEKPWPALLVLKYKAFTSVTFSIEEPDGTGMFVGSMVGNDDAGPKIVLNSWCRARGKAAYATLTQAAEALLRRPGVGERPEIREDLPFNFFDEIRFGRDFAAIWRTVLLTDDHVRRYDLVADSNAFWLSPELAPFADGLFRLAWDLSDGGWRLLHLGPELSANYSAHERLCVAEALDIVGCDAGLGLDDDLSPFDGVWMRRTGAHVLIVRGSPDGENSFENRLFGVIPMRSA